MALTLRELHQSHTDPTSLHGLNQAMFISDCLCKGMKEEDIIKLFHGDKQLVSMWVSFLKHNHWVEYQAHERKWALTAKGLEKTTGIIIA
jgi:hypothetical protein